MKRYSLDRCCDGCSMSIDAEGNWVDYGEVIALCDEHAKLLSVYAAVEDAVNDRGYFIFDKIRCNDDFRVAVQVRDAVVAYANANRERIAYRTAFEQLIQGINHNLGTHDHTDWELAKMVERAEAMIAEMDA